MLSFSGVTPMIASLVTSTSMASTTHLGCNIDSCAVFPANQRNSRWWKAHEDTELDESMDSVAEETPVESKQHATSSSRIPKTKLAEETEATDSPRHPKTATKGVASKYCETKTEE